MKLKVVHKIIIFCLLTLILALICSYYAFNYEENWQYPSYGTILTSNPVGEVVFVDGSVDNIYPESYNLITSYRGQIVNIRVLGSSPARLGDQVNVVGVLGPSNQIVKVQKISVLSKWKAEFLLLRSFFAIILMLIIFLYFWRFDSKNFEFRRR